MVSEKKKRKSVEAVIERHGKFGAIERLNLLRALTPLLCQSHRDKCF